MSREESLDRYNQSEKRRENERRYRERHKERILERNRAYRAANPERVKEIRERWYSRNRDKLLEQSRTYYHERADKDRKSALGKAWWAAAKAVGKPAEYVKRRRRKLDSNPYGRALRNAKARARLFKLEYDLTPEWAAKATDGRCAVSGIAFIPSFGKGGPFTPSVDRLDNTRGYTQDNCRFVIWAVNRFRSDDDDETVLLIARAIVAKNDGMKIHGSERLEHNGEL